MELHLLKPRIALNKAFLKVKPNRPEIEIFKKNLIGILDTIDEFESEEFHKNLVSDFLKNTWYAGNQFINTKGRNDLVIHNGTTANSTVGVIIEAKKPANKAEMLRPDNINCKAFQELVLYYLRERITNKNTELKHLIATNIYEWYIFDGHLFEKLFAQNKPLVKKFTDFEEGRSGGNKTEFFYNEIAAPAIAALPYEITFTYFDIRDYDKPLRNNDQKDDNVLIALYKLLSPEHLLKLPFANDSNSLDKVFYTELLHIIGLIETKEGGKKLIQRKEKGQRNGASLMESAIVQLDNLDKLSRMDKPSQYGDTTEERLFNVALELSITWINRILFLKLLEAQLIKYHKGDKTYAFLNTDKVKGFDDLNTLFFQVLAKLPAERNDEISQLFAHVPYLNSSLFEPTDMEHAGVFISQLNDGKLPLLTNSVIKDTTGKKRTGELTAVEYLFEFLNAYDFSSEGSEEIQEDNKRLINASVLGLIFEKINGYKDGSFFTPGFITMYMCRETIRRAVLQKFNELKGWNCQTLAELYDKIDDKKEANAIINSLKLCDPAVGSGHFLVSALNELIAIKSELKILLDREGKTLRDYRVEVENDELVVTDDDGGLFGYNPNNKESQRVQETLFHEKQTIIENCLFGVDLNPNSVKICRLRLWIELLKNAYYRTPDVQTLHATSLRELETLPNIDINIKCGNSLISRYALDADIRKALKRSKWTIDSYRLAVMTYRNAQSKDEKRAMERLIKEIKSDFESEIAQNDKRLLNLNSLRGELYQLSNQTTLFEQTKTEKAKFNKAVYEKATKIQKLETELDEIRTNKIYENAFEWRFEFPEVLNDEGDFMGFDVVIGNPPYGVDVSYLNYPTSDSYLIFYLRGFDLLKHSGFFSFITPDSWLINSNGRFVRELFTNNGCVYSIRDVYKVFDDAPDVWCNIPLFQKNGTCEETTITRDFPYDLDFFQFKTKWLRFKKRNGNQWFAYINDTYESIFNKMRENHSFKEFSNINRGFSPTPNPLNITVEETRRQVIGGEDFGRFSYKIKKKYLVDGYSKSEESINAIQLKEFIGIQRIRTNSLNFESRWLICQYFDKGYVPIDSISYLTAATNIKMYLGILNSRLLNIYYKFHYSDKNVKPIYLLDIPLPEMSLDNEEKITKIVNEVLLLKEVDSNVDTSTLESEIDQLVYQLYGLTEEEVRIVEGEK